MSASLHPSVMVIDDEVELAELYSRFLELSGFNCVYFTDPLEALDYFSKNMNRFSLVITDLKMPGIDGLELAKRVRKYNNSVKILLVTAFLVEENLDHDKVMESGIDTVLEKPFHFKDLRPMIKEFLTI
ncbi:MAG TPA: response regulator [Candidatus Nitrosocosmicus sp.]|nr:response regulator [Candidatus Nitrosocosmicus sp.]